MKKFLKYLKEYRKYIFIVLLLTFFDVMTELYLPNLMGQIVDKGIVSGNTAYILRVGLRMLLVSLLATLSMVVSSYFSAKAGMGFSKDLRADVFSHVESFSVGDFNKLGTSSLITRTTNDINQLQQLFMMALRMMIRAPFMLIGGLIMAISKNRSLSVLLLVAMPIVVISVLIVGRKGFPLFKETQLKVDNLNKVLREKLTGVRIIRAFNKVSYEEERFEDASQSLKDTSLKVNRLMVIMFPLFNLVLNFTVIGIIWLGSKQVDMGNMLIGDIMAFIQYVMLIMFSLIMFSVIFVVVPRAMASADRINEVLESEITVLDSEDPEEIGRIESLEFENVRFKYPNAENYALCDISFRLEAGESLAIIGGTGSGKTALVNLIPRFFDITDGSIRLNSLEIDQVSKKSLRERIGYVPQRAVLFSGTIEDNIRQGKIDASREEIEKAADIAQARNFIEDLEEGFQSQVAQGGSNFSGGQKQRLSIARALVRDADIFIFDDSFSALDFKTDARLRRALDENIGDSMKIIVAQRVSTVKNADKILVLDDGRMAGLGSHEELIRDSKVYREIIKSQTGEEAV